MLREIEYFLNGKIKEECGVFGVFNIKEASKIVYYGLHSLQHRGQEGCGIGTFNKDVVERVRGEGLVTEIFTEENLEKLKGNMGIGHVRYSTSGGGGIENTQPFLIKSHRGNFLVSHNGNIINGDILKRELELEGSIFNSTSDSEIIGHLIQREEGIFIERVKKALNKLEGAFSIIILTEDTMYGIRDKNGLRPLSLGKLNGGFLLSSESSAFDIVGGKYLRFLEPGEILQIKKEEISSEKYRKDTQNKMCAMEYIYFSRPDSNINNLNVHSIRRKSGEILALESFVEGDIVIGVPDSSLSSAMGYSDKSGITYEMGLIKNRYVGRTFIKPTQEERERGVRMKLSGLESIIRDKKVILVDDSIVRGTTSKYIVSILRECGAKEVHVRIGSAPITSPCFYGVDTSTRKELISNRLNEEKLCEYIGADSLKFLSIEGMEKAFGKNLCLACFTGEYPTEVYGLLGGDNE
ncbi:MAG: amidophosphoribosyltransferase [Cetobacterium sp.]|nr:amidophosphoribosyltransferase [Cetobacterium sp.]